MTRSERQLFRNISRLKQVQALLDRLNPDAPPQALIVPGSPAPRWVSTWRGQAPPLHFTHRGDMIVFPGSFNPPTTAHLALLKQARQFARQHFQAKGKAITHLYAAISKRTTDKERVERPLLLDRIMLLEMLLKRRLPGTGILLFNRGLYVEQAEAVRAAFPQVKRLYFLMGFDKIVQVLDPRYYENRDAALHDLFALADLLVAPRGNAGTDDLTLLLNKPENVPFVPHIAALPFSPAYRNISSTNLRRNLPAHLSETPQEVRRFINRTRAYAPPLRLSDGTEIDCYGERIRAIEALLKSGTAGR